MKCWLTEDLYTPRQYLLKLGVLKLLPIRRLRLSSSRPLRSRKLRCKAIMVLGNHGRLPLAAFGHHL